MNSTRWNTVLAIVVVVIKKIVRAHNVFGTIVDKNIT